MRMRQWGMITVILFGMLLGSAHAAEPQDVRRIYFTIDRAELLPAAQRVLHEVAELLRAEPGLMLQLVGHTCDLGSHEYNQVLARRRADQAISYLTVSEGIARERLTGFSRGEEQPWYPNSGKDNRAMNRRVVVSLMEQAAPDAGRAVGVVPAPSFTAAVLLMDINNSTNPDDLRAAVHQYLSQTEPNQRYHDRRLSRASGLPLFAAIARSCSGHMASQLRPRYLIIFSDGNAANTATGGIPADTTTIGQAVAAANANGVTLITVALRPATGSGRQTLQDLAWRTGGQAFVWQHERGPEQFATIRHLLDGATPDKARALVLVRTSR